MNTTPMQKASPPKRLPILVMLLGVGCVIAVMVGFLAVEVGTEGDNVNINTSWFAFTTIAVMAGCVVSALGASALLTGSLARRPEMRRLVSSMVLGVLLSGLVLALYVSAYIITFRLGWADQNWSNFQSSASDAFAQFDAFGGGDKTGIMILALYLGALLGGASFGCAMGFLVWAANFLPGLWGSSSRPSSSRSDNW